MSTMQSVAKRARKIRNPAKAELLPVGTSFGNVISTPPSLPQTRQSAIEGRPSLVCKKSQSLLERQSSTEGIEEQASHIFQTMKSDQRLPGMSDGVHEGTESESESESANLRMDHMESTYEHSSRYVIKANTTTINETFWEKVDPSRQSLGKRKAEETYDLEEHPDKQRKLLFDPEGLSLPNGDTPKSVEKPSQENKPLNADEHVEIIETQKTSGRREINKSQRGPKSKYTANPTKSFYRCVIRAARRTLA